MGAKQSKRSVEIGKEAGGAEEVAGGGAGGEGRVEPLADADALKPQANGDAHAATVPLAAPADATEPAEEKAKELKTQDGQGESAEKAPEDKEAPAATNGDPEHKENGESASAPAAAAAAPEDAKKPKKEKVKKKWSLRSISFSRKDKPKQEKKQKDDEAKVNGEPEKVLEEAVEATSETVVETSETVAVEDKVESATKEQKTPETPVTEPITNGSTTPDSIKIESPAADKPSMISSENVEPKAFASPEQLPINGLSLEETKKEITEAITKIEETSISTIKEALEHAPLPETTIKTEVCDPSMKLVEPVPPPLPASLPPNPIASFAATTMAPELTDALLDSTENPTNLTQHISPLSKKVELPDLSTLLLDTKIDITESLLALKEVPEEKPAEHIKIAVDTNDVPVMNSQIPQQMSVDSESSLSNEDSKNAASVAMDAEKINGSAEEASEANSLLEDLPPPSEVEIKIVNDSVHNNEGSLNNHCTLDDMHNEVPTHDLTEALQEKLRKKTKDALGNIIIANEHNGNLNAELTNGVGKQTAMDEDATPPSPAGATDTAGSSEASDCFPPPPSDLAADTQEIHSVSKKGADLLKEMPSVPDFKTETVQETSTDVVVAN